MLYCERYLVFRRFSRWTPGFLARTDSTSWYTCLSGSSAETLSHDRRGHGRKLPDTLTQYSGVFFHPFLIVGIREPVSTTYNASTMRGKPRGGGGLAAVSAGVSRWVARAGRTASCAVVVSGSLHSRFHLDLRVRTQPLFYDVNVDIKVSLSRVSLQTYFMLFLQRICPEENLPINARTSCQYILDGT